MPSAVQSVWAESIPVRVRSAGTLKLAGLLAVSLSLLAVPQALEAQGFIARANTSRTVWVDFGRGGPNQNGYESARAPVEYHVYACRGVSPGAILVRFRLGGDASASSTYWYEGERYQASGRSSARSALLAATATSPSGTVGSMQREATSASSMPTDCQTGGNNFADLGDVSRFADPTHPAAVAQFLNTVTLSAQPMSEPLRDYNLEQEFARQRRAAEAEREARERQAAETRAAQERQAAQAEAPRAQSPDSAAAAQQTPAQAAAAEQAARQDEARRAAERAEEEARRQREQQEELAQAAGEMAGMAARVGGAFGVYYFTGGDPNSSLYTFTEMSGLGLGFNFGPMIMDVGQFTGTYSSYFVEDYAEENNGLTPESGQVDGWFVHVGLQWQTTLDALRFGLSGGYLHAVTYEAEVTTPTAGLILGYSMLKLRVDLGLSGGDIPAGYALYLQF
jgi:hypothetical protein